MPSKPLRPCKTVGCPELTHDGYCINHKRIRQKSYDSNRPSWHSMYASKRWKDARIIYLSDNPFCIECSKLDRLIPATVVDHIVDHKGNYDLFWDTTNWQGLCYRHHNSKTAKQNNNLLKNN